MKVLDPMSDFPAWGPDKGMGILRESDVEGQRDLITGLPQDWGKPRLQCWRAHTQFCMHRDSEERSRAPQETDRDSEERSRAP